MFLLAAIPLLWQVLVSLSFFIFFFLKKYLLAGLNQSLDKLE